MYALSEDMPFNPNEIDWLNWDKARIYRYVHARTWTQDGKISSWRQCLETWLNTIQGRKVEIVWPKVKDGLPCNPQNPYELPNRTYDDRRPHTQNKSNENESLDKWFNGQ